MSERHWVDNEGHRKQFWAVAKNEINLTEDEVHEGLGVESVRDWKGTGAEAIARLREYKREMDKDLLRYQVLSVLGEGPEGLAEAPASLNTFGLSSDGWNVQVTLRDTSERRLLERFAKLAAGLIALGVKPCDRNGNYKISPAMVERAAASVPTGPPPPPQATPSPPTASSSTGRNNTETFLVEKIQAQLTPNGNRKYATIGGKYRKYGVTAWPEVAEEELDIITGYNPADLDAGQEWDVSGFGIVALCEHPADKEYPTKVLSFAPLLEKQ